MKSINKKLIPIIAAALTLVFVINNVVFCNILETEILEQWKTEDYKLVVSYGQTMQALGCDTTEEYQDFIDDLNSQNKLNYALYMEDVAGVVTAIAHSNHERIGLVLEDAGSIAAARNGEPYADYYTDPVSGGMTLDILTPIYNAEGKLQGALNIGIPVDDATMGEIMKETVIRVTAFCFAFAIGLIILLCIFVHLLVLKPLRRLGARIETLSNYDLRMDENDVLKKYQKRKDEIGTISGGFLIMQESLLKMVANIQEVAGHLSDESVGLSEVCEEVHDSSTQLSKTVEEVAEGATTQAQQTTEGNVQMNKLSSLIEIVEENMESLNEATAAVEKIEQQGIDVLDILVKKTAENNQSSKRVQTVIEETSKETDKIKSASEQIRGIAGQTNLLALNASIEAARAGDAGRGFAVVATEIGNLAQETNALTTEIEQIIQELFNKMQEAVETIAEMEAASDEQSVSVDETRNKFEEITQTISVMEEQCKKLSDSTIDMKESRKTIVDVINDLSALSQENAACMEEAAASVNVQSESIEKVSASSRGVAGLAEKLNAEIERFTIS